MDVGTSEKKQKLFTWLNSGNEDFVEVRAGVGRQVRSPRRTWQSNCIHPYHMYIRYRTCNILVVVVVQLGNPIYL